jgi:hypothetical protein
LMLGVDLLRVFTRVRRNPGWLYNRQSCLDKPDILARWSFNCLLTFCAHIMVRRPCTLDLSVVDTTCFRIGFLQSTSLLLPLLWWVFTRRSLSSSSRVFHHGHPVL